MQYLRPSGSRRSLTATIFAAAIAAAMTGSVSAQTVTMDGQSVTPVISRNGHLFVPFRAPMERIGALVTWNSPTATATYQGEQLVTVRVGDRTEVVKGTTRTMTATPVLLQQSAFVPVEALTDICGAKVDYSADRQSATVSGCTLAGVNALAAKSVPAPAPAPAPSPSINPWPWLIALLAILAALAWWLSRRRTLYTTNVYSPAAAGGVRTEPVTPVSDDYGVRLKSALGRMNDPDRVSFAQDLSRTIDENRATLPTGLVDSVKPGLNAGLSGSPGAISSVIDQLRDRPQLLIDAVRRFVGTHPGGPLGGLA